MAAGFVEMPDASGASQDRIAVLLPNHLGDVVMATPVLRSLRRGRPRAHIAAVVRRPLDRILGGASWVDEMVSHDVYAGREPFVRATRRIALARRLRRTLRGRGTVVVLPNSYAGALLALASGAPRRVGYERRGRGFLLTDAVPAPRESGRFTPIAMERYYLNLALHMGCPDTGTAVELSVEPEAELRCDALFAAHGVDASQPLVCIAPGAAYGPSKIWPLAYYAELACGLARDGARVALVHGPGEEPLAREIVRLAGEAADLVSLGGAGMDLALLKSVIARAKLLLCNDAGARHVAAAFEVPTIVLMGPTSPSYTNLNLKRTRLLREPVECSPCQRKVCPIDHRCMTRLLPARVLAEARAALTQEGWMGSVELEQEAMR